MNDTSKNKTVFIDLAFVPTADAYGEFKLLSGAEQQTFQEYQDAVWAMADALERKGGVFFEIDFDKSAFRAWAHDSGFKPNDSEAFQAFRRETLANLA